MLLRVKKLTVILADKNQTLLSDIDLSVSVGQCVALLGPNGSGKTVLAHTIMGNPRYIIKQGQIYFAGAVINHLSPEQRVKRGIAVAWQNPPVIPGVKLEQLLAKVDSEKPTLNLVAPFLHRDINVGLSGGEKKISELAQLLSLRPKLVILDEIDSGLDFRKLKEVGKIIKENLLKKKVAVIIITHNGEILRYLKPEKTFIMIKGKIVCKGKNYRTILATLKKYGYKKCVQCSISPDR